MRDFCEQDATVTTAEVMHDNTHNTHELITSWHGSSTCFCNQQTLWCTVRLVCLSAEQTEPWRSSRCWQLLGVCTHQQKLHLITNTRRSTVRNVCIAVKKLLPTTDTGQFMLCPVKLRPSLDSWWFLPCDYAKHICTVLLSTSVCLSVKRVYCDKTKAPSERSSIMTNRESPTSFPMSLRWTSYVAPNPPKGASKAQIWPLICNNFETARDRM